MGGIDAIEDHSLERIVDNFPRLQELILEGKNYLDNSLVYHSLVHLNKLHSLKTLKLLSFRFADDILEKIILANPFLEELDLKGLIIKKEEFIALAKARNLKKLNASETTIDDTSLEEISRSCLKLVVLELDNCPSITCQYFITKGTWPLLEELRVTRTSIATNDLKKIWEAHPGLKLNHRYCPHSDEIVFL